MSGVERFEEYERKLRGIPYMVVGVLRREISGATVSVRGAGKVDDSRIKASGSVYIDRTLNIREINVAGRLEASEDLIAESITIAGSLDIAGYIECGRLSIAGSCKAKGIEIKNWGKVSGRLIVGEDIGGGKLEVAGLLKTPKSVKLRELRLAGKLDVGGTVECNYIELKLSSDSHADSIRAREILVEKSKKREVRVQLFGINLIDISRRVARKRVKPVLKVHKVIADHIEIYDTILEGELRGGNIVIGKEAVIKGNVYYTKNIVVDERATIFGEVKRIETR